MPSTFFAFAGSCPACEGFFVFLNQLVTKTARLLFDGQLKMIANLPIERFDFHKGLEKKSLSD